MEWLFRLRPNCRGWRYGASGCGWLAFGLHSVFLLLRGILAGRAPLSGLFSSLNFFLWCLGLFYFTYALRRGLRALGVIVLPLIFALLFFACAADKKITPLLPALKTIWFEIHVSSAFISYALFALGGAAALLSLPDKAPERFGLPAAEVVDDFIYRALAWGFLLFSLSMVSGGVWAYLAWSDYWVWTPKELWSIVIWVFYSTYFHARFTRNWQGKRAKLLAALGFGIVLFTYLGIGLLMKSSHPL